MTAAPSLGRTVDRLLGDSLRAAGFHRVARDGGVDWVRTRAGVLEVLTFQRKRATPEFEVLLERGTAVDSAPHDLQVRRAELIRPGAPLAERWPYPTREDLEARLREAWDLLRAGADSWWGNPDALDWDGWRALGLLDSEAPRARRPPRLP